MSEQEIEEIRAEFRELERLRQMNQELRALALQIREIETEMDALRDARPNPLATVH